MENKKVNINNGSFEQLQKIIHIGPKRARIILVSPIFRDIYELSTILGLGPKRMKDIIDQDIVVV